MLCATIRQQQIKMITTKIMFKVGIDKRKDFLDAKNVFNELVSFMSETKIQNRLSDTHKLYAKSGEIQEIILDKTKELGDKYHKIVYLFVS
jgi:hypothetical protein